MKGIFFVKGIFWGWWMGRGEGRGGEGRGGGGYGDSGKGFMVKPLFIVYIYVHRFEIDTISVF
jgi:hypothetical protein